MNTAQVAYDKDFYAWTNYQATLLKQRKFNEIDFDNIIEEIEALGRSERKELLNRMVVLIVHLLKWQFQPEKNGHSWGYTIKEQRRQILRNLKDSPSLKSLLSDDDWLQEVWNDAVEKAVYETGLLADAFPLSPIWTVDEILDKDFYPTPNQEMDNE